MINVRWRSLGLAALLAAVGALTGAPPARADGPAAGPPDPHALAARIDQIIDAKLIAAGVQPAAPATDAEFVRRIYLDLAGRIPSVSEVHEFLRDARPNKRERLIERLLDSPGYVNHFTSVWYNLLLPEADTNQRVAFQATEFEHWLKERIRENAGFDRVVRELLTAEIPSVKAGQRTEFNGRREGPILFYAAKEGKPENLAATTARLFLGVQIECAQCHDHPFAKWSREQFWGQAAFFAGVERRGGDFGPIQEQVDKRELAISNTDRVVQAMFLDGREPQFKNKVSSRVTLAEWMTAADNPFFARTAANRMWGQLFGVGIVEPVDDFTDEHKPSHPELLDELAQAFVAAKFDWKYLIRSITLSNAYQRSSFLTSPVDTQLFAHMPVKAMSGEQLYDSLVQATGTRDVKGDRDRIFFGFGTPRSEFVSKFASLGKRTETPTSILQALTLMNGKFVAEATSLESSEALTAVVESPFLDTRGRIEALYLSTLSRPPQPEEMRRVTAYLERDKGSERERYADVFWALLNSAEFRTNH
jgi:hypothetical protein